MLAAPLVGPAARPRVPKGAVPPTRPAPKPRVQTPNGRTAKISVSEPVAVPAKGFDPKTSRELPAKRDEHSRTYQNADGTQTTQTYQGRVNFRRKDGSWAPLDTTLIPRQATQAGTASPTAHVASPSTETPSATPSRRSEFTLGGEVSGDAAGFRPVRR